MRLTLLAVFGAAMALLILGVFGPKARAHNADSGWPYPPACCSSTDCRMISEGDLSFAGPVITIKRTGEKFLMPDAAPVEGPYLRRAKWSGDKDHPDNDYHRFSAGFPANEDGGTYCLFVPRPSI